MHLISINERHDRHAILYQLLSERDETINISHRAMPTWEDHVRFVESEPYEAWYFVVSGDGLCDRPIGACYLSRNNEIGISILKAEKGKGYGPEAIKAIIEKHGPGRYLANINPRNEPSKRVFSNLGFRKIQETYELNA